MYFQNQFSETYSNLTVKESYSTQL